jgi:hypothetical protein
MTVSATSRPTGVSATVQGKSLNLPICRPFVRRDHVPRVQARLHRRRGVDDDDTRALVVSGAVVRRGACRGGTEPHDPLGTPAFVVEGIA